MFCPHCGKELVEQQEFCDHCGARTESGPELIPAAGERVKTPWEDRETTGFFGGLSLTVRQVITSPTIFFRKMPVTGGLTDPLLFALIAGMTGLMFLYMWDILLRNSMQSLMTDEMRDATGRSLTGGVASSFAMIMMPFMLMLWLFIASGMLHVVLLMVHGARAGFEATFRVVGYSITPFLFLAVPYCGTVITMLWVMTVAIIGLKEAHGTSGGKSAFAVLFPFLFCCGLLIFVLVLFMGAIAASFGTLMNLH